MFQFCRYHGVSPIRYGAEGGTRDGKQCLYTQEAPAETIVDAGGAQWMKAGNGVIHDENPSPRFQREGGVLHALQFWINLPAQNKAQAPDNLALQAGDIPGVPLPGGSPVPS